MVSKVIAVSAVAAVAALVALGMFFIGSHAQGARSGTYINRTGASQPNAASSNSTGILFANTQYAQFAYLVSSNPLPAQAKAALSGFNLSSAQHQNGTRTMTITLLGSGAKQNIILSHGDRLYLIETSFGDDGFGSELNLGDDGFVLVDANGYILQ